ncbi:porin family protein [Pareuzebyella sediminis]|uniref:porin family protein n=1 Tax=Pareuzebyella sediminis TaxID=2607998 RepID=UPI0011EC5446|nr:porin family protein [Pareuzebyella sediminis]
MTLKRVLIFLVLLFAIQQSSSQVVIQGTGPSGGDSEVIFGVKTGLNVSTFLGKDFVDISPKMGGYIGGMAEIPIILEDLYFQPELLISFQGADIGPENLNLTYLHLPLMGKFHLTENIAAEVGPQISFLLADNLDKIDPSDTLKANSLQIGINFGGGYRLDEQFYFQFRFGFDFSQVLENTAVKNGIFSLGACYFL